MNYDKIGKFIQEKRKEKNLTQKELANKLGVTDRAVSKWERGVGCPDVSILEILSKELDCSILEILKGRKIENEIIKVTEADDYVKDSMNISKQITKEKIISYINKVLVTTIIFIFLLLLPISSLRLGFRHLWLRFQHPWPQSQPPLPSHPSAAPQSYRLRYSDPVFLMLLKTSPAPPPVSAAALPSPHKSPEARDNPQSGLLRH